MTRRTSMELCLIFIFLMINNAKGKTFLLELLNTFTVEQRSAAQQAVDGINAQLVANGSSFTLQIRNTSHQSDLYTYSSSLVSSDVIALLDFNALPFSASQISNITKIPIIRFHGSGNFKLSETCNAIIMSADYDSYAQATVQILDTFQWKKIALMVETSRFLEAFSFKTFTANKDYQSVYIQINREDFNGNKNACSCERLMKELAASEAEVVLLFANEKSSILMMAQCNPMKTYVWILQDLVSQAALQAHRSHMVITFGLTKNLNTKWNSKRDTLVLVYDAILMVAMALKHLHDNGSWLPGNSSATLTSNRETLYRFIKQGNTNSLVPAVQFDSKSRLLIKELRILNLINNTFSEIGNWKKAGSILTIKDRIHFNDRSLDRSLLKGREISVVTQVTAPFVMRDVSSDGRVTYYGFCIDILNKLASDLKFTYHIKLGDDGYYGAMVNGEWNGMIRELMDRKAEMIVAPLSRNVERQKYVAMTASFMYYTDGMVMKKTVIEDVEFFQFMAPYTENAWTVVAISLVVTALAVYILNYFSPYGYKNEYGTKTSEEFTLFNSFWFTVGSVLLQGTDHAPKATSGRVMAGFFWFVILAWISTYTANLVAFFTVDNFIHPVTNFEQAVDSDYDMGVLEKSNLHSLFLSAEYSMYRRAWKKMKRLPKNDSQALEWMRNGNPYIHILDTPILEYMAQKQPCDLFTFPGLESPRSYVFALKQGDPHVQEISLAILHLRENGFIEKLRRKYWEGTNECPNINTNRLKKKTIELQSVAGVFIVLAVGFLISLIVLAIEIYWHRRGRQRFLSLRKKTRNTIGEERSQEMVDSNDNKITKGDIMSSMA